MNMDTKNKAAQKTYKKHGYAKTAKKTPNPT